MFLIERNAFIPVHHPHALPALGDYLFIFHKSQVGLTKQCTVPTLQILPSGITPTYCFGHINQHQCLLWPQLDEPLDFYDARLALRLNLKTEEYQAIGFGNHIFNWRNDHRFCGRCAHKLQDKVTERALQCSNCKHIVYPKISPCVIVLITDNEKMLLARSAHFTAEMMSTLAGFVEIGESAEQTLVREVKEEVGIQVKNLKYICSQPWPFPDVLMLGFIAEYDYGEIVIDKNEIETAGWFDKHNLPPLPHEMSISRYLIEYYLRSLA